MKTYRQVLTSERLPDRQINNKSFDLVGYTNQCYPVLVFYDFIKEKWIDYDNGFIPISIEFWLEEQQQPSDEEIERAAIDYKKNLKTYMTDIEDAYQQGAKDCRDGKINNLK